ncbi:hypothetical protein D3C80_1190560 [compost metagenome]
MYKIIPTLPCFMRWPFCTFGRYLGYSRNFEKHRAACKSYPVLICSLDRRNYSSNLQICLSARNGRQEHAPKIPMARNSKAAPEPFPVPTSATHRLSIGCTAIKGSNTLSTNTPPHRYPKGMVKNCKVFLAE